MEKPLLVCTRNDKKSTFLIVGAVGSEQEFNSGLKEKCVAYDPTRRLALHHFDLWWLPGCRNFGWSFREAAFLTRTRPLIRGCVVRAQDLTLRCPIVRLEHLALWIRIIGGRSGGGRPSQIPQVSPGQPRRSKRKR